jgi:thioredoxin 1
MKILVFTASWCNPCKALKQSLASQGISTNITFVDIDDEPELTQQYGIRSVPTTIVLDEKSKETARISGSNQLAWYQNNKALIA